MLKPSKDKLVKKRRDAFQAEDKDRYREIVE
jgi:hypothetical protein